MDKFLQLKEVRKSFSIGGQTTEIIKGISLDIKKGDFITFMGASGSGKTTLLNLIATLDNVSSGSIIIDGIKIETLDSKGQSNIRKNMLSFIFQNYNLISSLTVKDNISLSLAIKGQRNDSIMKDIVDKLDISDIMEKYPHEISGGQRQRCACARALIAKKPILLADEPTGALDSENRKKFMNTLEKLNQIFGITIIMVTHDIFTACFSKKVYFIKDGIIEKRLQKDVDTNLTFFKKLLDRVEHLEDF